MGPKISYPSTSLYKYGKPFDMWKGECHSPYFCPDLVQGILQSPNDPRGHWHLTRLMWDTGNPHEVKMCKTTVKKHIANWCNTNVILPDSSVQSDLGS